MSRELILLNPYRLPSHNTLMLNADDVAVFLNGYLALWHPAAVRGATAPPKVASPYDHEQPTAGFVYAVPESPPLFLPDDWEQRVANAGANFFKATPSWDETIANLLRVLNTDGGDPGRNAPFFGIGLGYIVLEALFEAMDHLPQLAVNDFWQDVLQAVEAAGWHAFAAVNESGLATGEGAAKAWHPETYHQHLQAAAERLKEAREILYPSHVFLVDLVLLEALEGPLPSALEAGIPINFVASAEFLENMVRNDPERFGKIQERIAADQAEICGGPYRERDDALLPLESQLWNLRKGLETYRALLGQGLKVFARKRFGAAPQLPQLLNAFGLFKAILLPFDEGVVPQFQVAVIEWPTEGGNRAEAFTKAPHPAESPLTYFHLAYHLSRTMLHDPTASLALLHAGKPEAPWYRAWLELNRLGPVFGQYVTMSRFFTEVLAGEYPPASNADDFHSDYLHQLTYARQEKPVSRFCDWARQRRRLEAAWTLAGLYRGLVKQGEGAALAERLTKLEDAFELGQGECSGATGALQQEAAVALAGRLLAKATGEGPGYLLLNPCAFSRCVGVELEGVKTPLPAPARATQVADGKAHVVVEVPPLGFAWVPCSVAPGTKVAVPRIKLAEGRTVRNEFFEAEIDPQTGGLRVFRDARGRANRLGQQLVYGPGSHMRVQDIKVTSAGPALGEIVSEGALFDDHERVLATYRQRLRAWWARPLLELHIEINPTEPPTGYPWHAYYGSRFAWRDERALLLRAVNLMSYVTSHTRPETTDYLELREGAQSTAIFMGGLPFHQRHGQRMLDVILIAEGEPTRAFVLALGVDLQDAPESALDFVTPVAIVPTGKGPPHVGASGWLFQLDATNMVMTTMRPAPDGADAVIVRLVESMGVETHAELHCARNPVKAQLLNERDQVLKEAPVAGDAVSLDFAAGEIQRVRIDFS